MVVIEDLQYLCAENKKILEVIESLRTRVEYNCEMLSKLLDEEHEANTKNTEIEESSPKKKKEKKSDKLKKISKADTKAIDKIKDKLSEEGKNEIEVELIKIDKKSYYVDKNGVVYDKKAKVIGEYDFEEETIILE